MKQCKQIKTANKTKKNTNVKKNIRQSFQNSLWT